ncbi:MAG: inositol monophosphatase family protein [Acidobacteriota bacterium]
MRRASTPSAGRRRSPAKSSADAHRRSSSAAVESTLEEIALTIAEPTPADLLAAAEAAADAAAEIQRHYFRSRDLEIEEKEANDFVTRADKESEAAILELLMGRFPDHAVLAEESGLSEAGGDYRWFVDPLDGTSNFLQGLPYFCVSIACQHRGVTVASVVLEPLRGERFTATRSGGAFWNGRPMSISKRPGVDGAFLATGYPFRAKAALDVYLDVFRDLLLAARGVRRCGAAALDLAYTAAGVYDGFFEFRLSPWDIAAGSLLVEEAGGVLSDLDGADRWLEGGSVLAANAEVHGDILEIVSRHVSEASLRALSPR